MGTRTGFTSITQPYLVKRFPSNTIYSIFGSTIRGANRTIHENDNHLSTGNGWARDDRNRALPLGGSGRADVRKGRQRDRRHNRQHICRGIVNPHLHTIGGEAPILVRPAGTQRVFAINGNTAAPARATIEHFRSLGITLIPGQGLLAAGVPAALDALLTALENFGTFTLAQVLEPALELAGRLSSLSRSIASTADLMNSRVVLAALSGACFIRR